MALQTPLSWLQDFVELSMPPSALAERLTTAGLEVELIEKIGENWGEYCVVGQVVEIRKHRTAFIMCKNFQNIHHELLDIFYSYMASNILSNVTIKYIFSRYSLRPIYIFTLRLK